MTTAAATTPFRMARVGRQTLIYGLGILLSKAVSFIMLPVYTRFLSPADYGVMELIGMTLDIIATVAGARLATGIFRYYHKAESEAERRAVVSTAMISLACSYGAVGFATFLAAAPLSVLVFDSPQYTTLIRIAAGSLALQSLILVPLAYARVREQPVMFVVANVVKLLIALSLNIFFLVYAGMGVEGVFWANFISTAVVGSWLAIYVFRAVGIHFSRAATRDLLRYGVPLIATQCATFILTFGDRYFLQSAADITTVGIYSLAYQFGFLLAAIGYIPFETVWEPVRFQIANRPDRDEVLSRGFRYMSLVLLSTAVGISLYVEDLLRIMATPAFLRAADLVPIILVAYVLQGWTSVHDVGILVRERTEYVTLANWVATLVALVGYAILIPRFLGMGAAVATAISFAVRFGLIYAISQRLWPVRYDWRPVLKLAALATMTALAGIALPATGVITSLLVNTLLLLGYFGGVWSLGILSADDRHAVRQGVRSVRLLAAGYRG